MRPTFSIIFFTTASGAGYGLLALAGILAPIGWLPVEFGFGLAILVLALVLVTGGLLSSTFHLGHPERAWRAVTQWRSSWLSREGVAALLTYPPVLLFAVGWLLVGNVNGIWALFGVTGALMAVLTVLCTGQIYATLRAIPRWHNPLVTPNYLLLSLASGAVWLNTLAQLFGHPNSTVSGIAIATVVAAWVAKRRYWQTTEETTTATAETATGLGAIGKVRHLEAPHWEENYLLHEMGFQVGRRHAAKLRHLAEATAFAVPALVTIMSLSMPASLSIALAVLAALSISLGVVVERWLFFAEAKHAVQLYYGEAKV